MGAVSKPTSAADRKNREQIKFASARNDGVESMGTIGDLRRLLKDIPIWRDLGTLPDRVAALEKQVKALEEKLGEKWPPDICRLCGARGARLAHSHLEKTVEVSRFRMPAK
jgi:hypothetical protein